MKEMIIFIKTDCFPSGIFYWPKKDFRKKNPFQMQSFVVARTRSYNQTINR